MVDIEKIAKEISKKRKYDTMNKDEVYSYAASIIKEEKSENENKAKRKAIIALDTIDKNLWELRENIEYAQDEKLNGYVKELVSKGKILSITIPAHILKELADFDLSVDEYFEYKKIFKDNNLPEVSILSLMKMPNKLKGQISSNLNEPTFRKIIGNGYCKLYSQVELKRNLSSLEKREFLRVLNVKNNLPLSVPYDSENEKDTFHVNMLDDLKNIDDIRANKLDELMSDEYSTYDIKREFCNRFMDIDPIILENCFYYPQNKEILENLEEIELIKKIVNIGADDKKDMIEIYNMYMYSGRNIELPDNLVTYGYIFSTTEEVKELKNAKLDYSKDKFYHEIYFCRECLLDSNQRKKDRETQLEIPIGELRNNRQIVYENVVRNNVYDKNMAYPKIELTKEEIAPSWVKKDYLTLEAISSDIDINNPKRFEKEIPKSKNYSYLYASYEYKKQEELEKNKYIDEINEAFDTARLRAMIDEAADKKLPHEDDLID